MLHILMAISCKKDRTELPIVDSIFCSITTGSTFVIKDNALQISNLHSANETFLYDDEGRISTYMRTGTTRFDESYTIEYAYSEMGIIETYTNEEYGERFVQRYTLDEKARIAKAVADENQFGKTRITTYKYDDMGYLVEKHIHSSDPNSGILEDRLTYSYDHGNLVQIDNDMSNDGLPGVTYTTTITYTDQPQNGSFIYHQGYPVLHEQYNLLRSYFGKSSENMISSIREFLGFSYANYWYVYEFSEAGFVKEIKKTTDSNQGQEFEVSYELRCE